MDRFERTQEQREALRRESVDVDFLVDCDCFTVPGMYGLDFSATYEVSACVTPDNSGNHETPNGPAFVTALLGDVTEYSIAMDGAELPKWLQEHLATEYASEMDDAFLEAIGGQSTLDNMAIERAS